MRELSLLECVMLVALIVVAVIGYVNNVEAHPRGEAALQAQINLLADRVKKLEDQRTRFLGEMKKIDEPQLIGTDDALRKVISTLKGL